MKFRRQTWLTLFLIGLFVYVIAASWDWPLQARLFPWTIGFISLVLLSWQLLKELRATSEPAVIDASSNIGDWGLTEDEVSAAARRRTLEMFGWTFGLIAGLWLFGFYLAIPIMIFLYLRRHGQTWTMSLTVPLCFWLMIWGVFDQLLHLPFPPGLLLRWLGLEI